MSFDKIKQRLGRNNFNREDLGTQGVITRGQYRRGRALKADHKRNIAIQGGYPDTISLRQHYDMAYRNGLGSNLAFGIVKDTWRVPPVIYDGDEDAERREISPTKFEQAVDETFDRLDVWKRIIGLDIAQRPMRYGGLMYITMDDDAATNDELVSLPTIDYLIDLRVYHEAQLQVEEAYQNPALVNYGMPMTYGIRTNVAGSTNEWENSGYRVHGSRVYAYGEGAYDGGIYGAPCNEGCFEALMDAAKVRMSGAEGFFQNAANKYVNTLPPEANLADAEAVLESMDDFDNENSKSMVTAGDIKMLQTTLADPTNAWTIAANECAAHHEKPMPIIIGQMTGVLASEENIKGWNRIVMDRQESTGNDIIAGLLKDWMIKFNFPKPTNEINIVWRDLNESTADQKADLAKKRVETNKIALDSRQPPIYSTEYIQQEAGAPVEDVVDFDIGGEEGSLDIAGEI